MSLIVLYRTTDTTHFVCGLRFASLCPARAVLRNGQLRYQEAHNHPDAELGIHPQAAAPRVAARRAPAARAAALRPAVHHEAAIPAAGQHVADAPRVAPPPGIIQHAEHNVDFTCCVCLEAKRNRLCRPCGHAVLCNNCVDEMNRVAERHVGRIQCPICSIRVDEFLQVYV